MLELHKYWDVITGFSAVAWFVIGLMVKNQLLKMKSEILEGQAKISGALGIHIAEDDVKHTDFDRRITRLEDH